MKTFFLFSFFFLSSVWADSTDFPIPRLKGLYSYQEHFEVSNIRRAETVPSETPEGQKRIRELRSQGYTCIRKNPETRLCSKNWRPTETPAGLSPVVQKFMAPVRVDFEGSSTPPRLIQDGSTTQEWEVLEMVQVLGTEMHVYHVVRHHSGKTYVVFPVNEDQPMSPLTFHSVHRLALTLVGNFKDTDTSTTAYTIEAFLEN